MDSYRRVPIEFPTTQWADVAQLRSNDSEIVREALSEFLNSYIPALEYYLVRGLRLREHDAEDIVQGFVADKVIAGEILKRARQQRGKLRSFLMRALTNYALDSLRSASREKRRRKLKVLNDALTAASVTDPHKSFDVAWAHQVIRIATDRMKRECKTKGIEHVWLVFGARLLNPMLQGVRPVPYVDLVERHRLKTPQQATMTLATGKKIFRRTLISVLKEYAATDADLEEEITTLKQILMSPSA